VANGERVANVPTSANSPAENGDKARVILFRTFVFVPIGVGFTQTLIEAAMMCRSRRGVAQEIYL